MPLAARERGAGPGGHTAKEMGLAQGARGRFAPSRLRCAWNTAAPPRSGGAGGLIDLAATPATFSLRRALHRVDKVVACGRLVRGASTVAFASRHGFDRHSPLATRASQPVQRDGTPAGTTLAGTRRKACIGAGPHRAGSPAGEPSSGAAIIVFPRPTGARGLPNHPKSSTAWAGWSARARRRGGDYTGGAEAILHARSTAPTCAGVRLTGGPPGTPRRVAWVAAGHARSKDRASAGRSRERFDFARPAATFRSRRLPDLRAIACRRGKVGHRRRRPGERTRTVDALASPRTADGNGPLTPPHGTRGSRGVNLQTSRDRRRR